MANAAHARLTRDGFYDWIVGQETRHELVDGVPVAMAGANRRHDRITFNMSLLVGNHLRGHRCQPFTSDTYVSIPAGNARQPDLGIDCGPFQDTSLEAAEPVLVVEILSPTTRMFDCYDKLEEYKTVPTLEYILLVDPDYPQVRLYQRDAGRSWVSERLTGLEAIVALPMFLLELRLSDVYANLELRPRPSLVNPDNPTSRYAI